MSLIRYLFAALALLLSLAAHAAEEDGAPITVEADRLELNQKSGVSVYQGNVRLQQDTLLLLADRLELHSKGGRLQQAVADGSPVRVERTDPQSGELTRAEASHMEYRFADGLLELMGNAHLWRAGDEFSGKHLIYDTGKQLVRAFGDKERQGDNGRVRVILQPEKGAADE